MSVFCSELFCYMDGVFIGSRYDGFILSYAPVLRLEAL